MNKLKSAELKAIEHFFQLSQENLLKVMCKYLKSKYETVYCSQHYVVAIGDIPVGLVAHLDTVFKSPPTDIFYDAAKNVMWSPEGLGADDRAGVYSIIQILKSGLKPTVIFTTDEEVGGIGASKLVEDFPTCPTELKYLIELDRRGSVDCVFYDCDNEDFREYVEKFGFVTAWGTFSDISIICPVWKAAGVNLSIGYLNEHSYSEVLYIGHMKATIRRVVEMLKDVDNTESFKYIPTIYAYNNYFINKYGGWNTEDYGWDPSYGISKSTWMAWHQPESAVNCISCGNLEHEDNLYPVKNVTGETIFICPDCLAMDPNAHWCRNCGEAFLTLGEDREYCYDCVKREVE